jgi:hypothetical protein
VIDQFVSGFHPVYSDTAPQCAMQIQQQIIRVLPQAVQQCSKTLMGM